MSSKIKKNPYFCLMKSKRNSRLLFYCCSKTPKQFARMNYSQGLELSQIKLNSYAYSTNLTMVITPKNSHSQYFSNGLKNMTYNFQRFISHEVFNIP
jgi:hypothetical protein